MPAVPRLSMFVLRAVGAVLLATQGVVHLRLWADGYRSVATIGPLFLVGAVGALVVAVAVLVTDRWWVLAAGALLSVGQVAALVMSSTVGLFGFETRWMWTGTQGVAVWAELLAIAVLAGVAVWSRDPVPA